MKPVRVCTLLLTIVLLLLSGGQLMVIAQQDQTKPKVSFTRCDQTGLDISVSQTDLGYRVHVHLALENCMNRRAFARVRCCKGLDTHLTAKEFTVGGAFEAWSVYLDVPRFDDAAAIYQLEIGLLVDKIEDAYFMNSPNQLKLDTYLTKDTFAWSVQNGELNPFNDRGDAKYIRVIPQVVEFKSGGAFFAKFGYGPEVKEVSLKYGFAELPTEVSGEKQSHLITK